MYDKKTLLDFAFWWHNGLTNAERREVDIDFETYFANYENRWFYEFKRFYEYCNVNKEFIGCNQALTEKQWDVLIWNMAFCHADLLK